MATFPAFPRGIFENDYSDATPLVIDFDHNGSGDVFMVGYGSVIEFTVAAGNRAFIFSSPPPNLGGRLEILGTGFRIGEDSGQGTGSRWFEGFSYAFTAEVIGVPLDSHFIGFGSGSVSDGSSNLIITSFFYNTSGYFGIEFAIGDETHYGWVHVSNEEDLGVGGYIDAWAYETEPGASIRAGAAPEPGVTLLVMLGAACFLRRRR